jgi:hypothetical protein
MDSSPQATIESLAPRFSGEVVAVSARPMDCPSGGVLEAVD